MLLFLRGIVMAEKGDKLTDVCNSVAKNIKIGDCCYTKDEIVKMGMLYLAILVIAFII